MPFVHCKEVFVSGRTQYESASPPCYADLASHGNAERDARGRFSKGNRGGPGNPFARQITGLRRALIETVIEKYNQDVGGSLSALTK
jgi:hypothetical protein